MTPTTAALFEAAVQRCVALHEVYDRVVVSFSGGKDSGLLLEVALEAARRCQRLPLEVMHIDCEVSTPETVAYVERTAARKEVVFHWYCLPLKVENAFSRSEEYFVRWDPDARDRWFRPLPATAITEVPWFKGRGFKKFIRAFGTHTTPKGMRCVQLVGLRKEESFLRNLTGNRSWLYGNDRMGTAHPIMDVLVSDLWAMVGHHGWDHNGTYAVMHACGIPERQQRIGVVAKREGINDIRFWQRAYPHLLPALLARVDGLAEHLADVRHATYELPMNMANYADWSEALLDQFAPDLQQRYLQGMQRYIDYHFRRTEEQIPDAVPHPASGLSWRFICKAIIKRDMRGDMKHRLLHERTQQVRREARVLQYIYEL